MSSQESDRARPAPLARDALPASPVAALFPDAPQRRQLEDWLSGQLLEACARVALGPVTPTFEPQRMRAALSAIDFESPRPLEPLLAWTIEQLETGVVHLNNPRYFGLFNPAPSFPAQCADRIAGAFNPQLASSGTSPAAVEIEAHVIRALARRAGLPPESVGHFTTSGSEANATALVCALTRAAPQFGVDGVHAFGAPVAIYTSRDCQPGWFKVAHQCGIGRAALRLVQTDGEGRMHAGALREAIASDRAAGRVPVLISATAGTTNAGVIDPLHECAAIAREQGLWYHVDAAWGGAALASERLRGLLSGIERADSITIDAHKWLATTMGCAMYITSRAPLLSEAFHASTSFMPSSLASLDPYLNTVQWSRRFLGLRLFLALGAAGWSGLGAHVERSVAVIEQVRERLLARGWSVVNDSALAVLDALPPKDCDVRALVRQVVASGRAWVAPASFERRDVVRICATHGETSESDVEELLEALDAAAA